MSKNSKEVIRAQKRKKLFAVNFFGGKCQICGYNKCLDALEFHHVDKDNKNEEPTYIITHWSWERAKIELEKCILVCSNCHREIHSNEINFDLQKYVKPWISKLCPTCNTNFDTKEEKQLYCSIECRSFANRITERPTKEQLSDLIVNKISWTKMGKMFNVSDNAVRKWAKAYHII